MAVAADGEAPEGRQGLGVRVRPGDALAVADGPERGARVVVPPPIVDPDAQALDSDFPFIRIVHKSLLSP